MISKDEVKHIAELARIKLTESQIEKYQKELSGILDFVGKLSEVKTENIQPIRQITGLESVFRKDKDRDLLDQKSGRDLIKQAPEHKEGYVMVPEVLKGK
ncbi:MAG: Asp-tRNA(Asn)/Glu-tRNA(Gln) amidotransferase subunit GatC [Parcubacteria group bacterium]|nr:Asp-tRNA(Asn)/Glu-tRNA(Gln) amidotransferase subunit GatC [Parcubacteria group bacterium]